MFATAEGENLLLKAEIARLTGEAGRHEKEASRLTGQIEYMDAEIKRWREHICSVGVPSVSIPCPFHQAGTRSFQYPWH